MARQRVGQGLLEAVHLPVFDVEQRGVGDAGALSAQIIAPLNLLLERRQPLLVNRAAFFLDGGMLSL